MIVVKAIVLDTLVFHIRPVLMAFMFQVNKICHLLSLTIITSLCHYLLSKELQKQEETKSRRKAICSYALSCAQSFVGSKISVYLLAT